MTDPAEERAALWEFVVERDAIRLRRESGMAPPWTSDPTLRDYHFTNVHRRLDPGTRWLLDLVARRGLDDPLDLLFTSYCYRSLNRVGTFERFGLPWRDAVEVADWVSRVDAARDAGVRLGSTRHLTYYARLRARLPGLVERHDLAEALWNCQDGVSAIRLLATGHLDVGPFLGTQVVADLATIAPTDLGFDADTVVPVSGGSRFSLALVEGTVDDVSLERGAYDERTTVGRQARMLRDQPVEVAAMRRLLAEQPLSLSMPLTFIDLEHSLCEYSRYRRLRAGDLTRATWLKRRPR